MLDNRLSPGRTPTAGQLRHAARYLLAELPMFLDTRGIIGTGTSVFCYHQCIPFLHQLYHRELPCTPAAGQGFAVVIPTPREAPDSVH